MTQKKQLSILEFSRLTGIKRENLRFYDRIGLLSPETRGENRYRYYSRHQLSTAYLIGNLRGLGLGLDAIREYSKQRTPEKMLALFSYQDAAMQEEIRRLEEMRKMMALYSSMAREALKHAEEALFLEEKEAENIFLCPPIPAHMDDDEGVIFSYEYAAKQGLNLAYPLGAMVAQHCLETEYNLESVSVTKGMCYYFKAAQHSNTQKPAGLYAVLYASCDSWKTDALYLRLLKFIRSQEMQVCGAAYEEYPLDDVAVQSPERYGIRVEIPVKPVV